MWDLNCPCANFVSKFLLTMNLFLDSKFHKQYICRCHLHKNNHAGKSSWAPARHKNWDDFSSGRPARISRSLHDAARIARPSWPDTMCLSESERNSVHLVPVSCAIVVYALDSVVRVRRRAECCQERYGIREAWEYWTTSFWILTGSLADIFLCISTVISTFSVIWGGRKL